MSFGADKRSEPCRDPKGHQALPRSLLGHAGFAQTGDVCRIKQGAGLGRQRPQKSAGLDLPDARKRTFAAQPSGFGERGGGVIQVTGQGISCGEVEMNERFGGSVDSRFFEPDDDRLVGARLQ